MKKKKLRFLRQQNRGSAIVIVIVAMAFVGILGSTLMWMSLMNYRMKTTDRQVKESFYNAETVFEQLIVGLQNVASDSADQSYSFIMQNYANFEEGKRNTEFQKEYLKSIRKAIAKSETETDQFDLEKLMLYVDTGLDVGVVTPSPKTGSWIGARTTDPSKIGGDEEFKSRYGAMESPLNADYIMLRGLHLEYTDEDGFLSMIDTDIMISTPDAGFTQSGRVSNVFDYAIIADKGIEIAMVSGYGSRNDVKIKGNIYSGENGPIVNISDPENVLDDKTGEGLIIDGYTSLTVEKADYLVSKGGVLLNENSALTVGKGEAAGDMTELWVSDIQLGEKTENKANKRKDKNVKLSLFGHAFVKDDLTLNADNAEVNLTGSYYAYGNGTDKAENSSAIIVNGEGNKIDLSGLTHLLLAGHAYTSVGGDTVKNQFAELKDVKTKVEIPTGESIAVKGNQVAYMVPDECIGVLYGQSVYNKNPMSKKEYEDLYNNYISKPDEYGSNFKEVDVDRQISRLGSLSLASYGISYPSGIKKVFLPSNGETMVYYYLLFPRSEDAERYFADYYAINKDKLDRYTGLYANGGIISPDDYTRITVQGNYIETDRDDGTVELKRRTDNISAGNNLDMELLAYQNTFESLTTALTSNFMAVSEAEKNRSVYENIVDAKAFRDGVVDADNKYDTWKISVGESGNKYVAVLSNKDVILGNVTSTGTSNDAGYKFVDGEKETLSDGSTKPAKVVLIIASGDVIVEKPFEGVIIAGGKVVIKNNATVTSAKVAGKMSELIRVLQAHHSNKDTEPRPLDYIRGADQYVLAGTALTKDDVTTGVRNIDFSDFVKYQNWTKK